jgi:sulfhydrogenase subunit beta (sulfur reductase)
MTVKKLTKQSMDDWVDALVGSETVYGPQKKGEKFDFKELKSAQDLRLDYDVSLLPPKKYVLPVDETLMTYKVGGAYSSTMDDEKFVLLGIHPYDMVAISQMDVLFTQDNYDTHYMQRRKNATIVVCDVINASDNVFASSMHTAVVQEGYDVLITAVDDGYVVEAATDKGKLLLAKAKAAVDATQADLDKRTQIQDANKIGLNKHPLHCDTHSLPRLLEKSYHHGVWQEKAKTCFACGSCNLVCPTCYCFDVQDDVQWDMKNGKRARCWDGCLLNGFAKVAGDHDFRANRADRFRHRLYRKAKYVPAKLGGEIACVGCGRCVGACLPDIANPVTVYNQLLDEIGIS